MVDEPLKATYVLVVRVVDGPSSGRLMRAQIYREGMKEGACSAQGHHGSSARVISTGHGGAADADRSLGLTSR